MSDYYQSIANNQHEMLQNMSEGAINVENANIEALNEWDKKNEGYKKKISDLQDKLTKEAGKKEVVDGVPISEDDIAELVGGKATINLMRNTYHVYKTGVKTATEALNPALTGSAFLEQSGNVMRGVADADKTVSRLQKTKIMGQSLIDGFKPSTTKAVAESGLKQAVSKATQEATLAGKTGEDLLEAGKVAKEEFLKGGVGGVLGKIGAGVSIADGLSLANQDIQGLREGKGWGALGANWEERASNITGMVGDALSLFPPTEVLGGITDVASGILDHLGESKEDTETQNKISDTQKAQEKNKVPPLQQNTVHPSMASLGMIANISHPAQEMIQGSGAF